MSEKIITLSGAAMDVLYSLFFRGALQSGDLPAKSGAAELRELGFAETRHTATEYQKENYFTFLTAEGQEFAIKHLVNTRFGVKQYRSAINIGVELDTSDAQKALDELDDKIRNSDAFKVLKDGWSFEKNGTLIINHGQVFIRDAMIQDSSISKAKIGSALASSNGSVSTTCELTTRGKLSAIVTSYMAGETTEFTDELVSEVMKLFDKTVSRRLIDSCIEESIRLNCRPGGAIWKAMRGR